jgi:hypothetical protein
MHNKKYEIYSNIIESIIDPLLPPQNKLKKLNGFIEI